MVRMEEIQAAMDLMSSQSAKLEEKMEERGKEWSERIEGGLKEQVLRWFVETQASLIVCDGEFPTWFHGFISRQEAEDHLKDKSLGVFLIRLSEKARGYILSYKGQDRCRHFVINQTQNGMLVVSGDLITHNSLPELIEYFRITPIQPFGECLISEKVEESSDDLYDVVHCKPCIKSGVSVQALRSLWECDKVTLKGPPALPPKSSNRKLISSTSIDTNSIVQIMPPAPKRNLPLRNSLSGGHLSHGSEQHDQSDQRWPSKIGSDEGLHQRRRMEPWDKEGFSSLDPHLLCYSAHSGPLSTSDEYKNSQSRSMPHLDEDHCTHSLPASPHPHLVPPKSASFSASSLLFIEQNQPGLCDLPAAELTALQFNPLYQTSSGLSAGHNSCWGPLSIPQPSQVPEISSKPNSDPLVTDTYQDISEDQNSNTYEDLPMIQQTKIITQENNTYEDIPGTQSNTYAELQPTQPSSLGKKTHKWWKFKPENKRK